VLDSDATIAEVPPRPRRIWLRLLAGVTALALIGTGIAAVVYAHTYQPLGAGNYGNNPRGAGRAVTDGVIDPTRYIIVGPPGSVATFGYSVSNYGHFAVRMLGSDLSSVEFVHFDLGWTL
jgi:hypothetical protein